MIPRITHQIFMQGFDALPEIDRARILAFRARNPGWDHRFYDCESAEAWLAENCSQAVQDAYHSIDSGYYAVRADLLRYLICYHHGGVYLDVKSEALRPLDDVLHKDDCYLLSQWPERRGRPAGQGFHRELSHVPGDEYVIWFIASVPGHPFLTAVLDQVMNNIAQYDPWRCGVGAKAVLKTTGPIAYTIAIHPILDMHPHRLVKAEIDLDFHPFRHGDFKSHRGQYGRHYSTVVSPIVRSGYATDQSVRVWFGFIHPRLLSTRRRILKVAAAVQRKLA